MKTTDSFTSGMMTGALVLLVTFAANAQQYTIPWFTIDGGGGTSAGGVYAVSGTIGQPDAGILSSGQFSLVGGFWALPTAVQTPGAPLLSIEQVPGGVRVFWPLPATDFVLDESMTLASTPPVTVWSLVPLATYETNATHISVTVHAGAASAFYRLRKP